MVPSTHLSLLRDMADPNTQGPAWAAFQRRYGPVIRSWCSRGRLQEADVEDLCQKVMLNLYRSLGGYDRSKGLFRVWLRSVVRNAVTDHFRQMQRRPGDQGSGDSNVLELLAGLEGSGADELASTLETQLDGDLQRAMATVRERVAERTWQAFTRVVLEEQPRDQVAADLGMSRGAIYQNAHRVRELIAAEHTRLQAEANDSVEGSS